MVGFGLLLTEKFMTFKILGMFRLLKSLIYMYVCLVCIAFLLLLQEVPGLNLVYQWETSCSRVFFWLH